MIIHPLRAERERRQLSQRQLAELAGVSVGSVARIEQGTRLVWAGGVLGRVANALELPVNEITAPGQLAFAEDDESVVARWFGLDLSTPGTREYLEQVREQVRS